MTGRGAIVWLVAANMLPVLGVLLLDWDVFSILFLFWCENVVIGLFGIARTAFAPGKSRRAVSAFLPLFFLVHYGGFMFGHLMVLTGLFADSTERISGASESVESFFSLFDSLTLITVVALVFSHGWSFAVNFLGRKEYEGLTGMGAMAMPYKRMMITHVALIAGGFFLIRWGEPVVGLIMLVGMKIAMDLEFHRREHAQLATQQI